MDVRVHIGRSAGRITPPWYCHLVVKMNSNLADLPLVQPADQPPKNKQQFQIQFMVCYIYYGMYLAAILDSSRKGGNFFLFLNN